VIVTFVPGAKLPNEFKKFIRARSTTATEQRRQQAGFINGQVLDLPNGVLKQLATNPSVFRIHYDARSSRTTTARRDRRCPHRPGDAGVYRAGVGVAIIDSGITTGTTTSRTKRPSFTLRNQRVSKFVDFVNGRPLPYDDNGHGSHVAGIIAQRLRSQGEKNRIAPGANLVSLKVLDQNGQGTISNIIGRSAGWRRMRARTTFASSTCQSALASWSPTGPTR